MHPTHFPVPLYTTLAILFPYIPTYLSSASCGLCVSGKSLARSENSFFDDQCSFIAGKTDLPQLSSRPADCAHPPSTALPLKVILSPPRNTWMAGLLCASTSDQCHGRRRWQMSFWIHPSLLPLQQQGGDLQPHTLMSTCMVHPVASSRRTAVCYVCVK